MKRGRGVGGKRTEDETRLRNQNKDSTQMTPVRKPISSPGTGHPPLDARLTFRLHVLPFGRLPDVDGEHHYLRSHGGHPVAKAELVRPVHVSSERVLPTGLPVPFVNPFIVGSCNLQAGEKRRRQGRS